MSAGDILVVDDNPNNLDLLAGILREHGYGARMANDGRRALAVVRAHPPELILLDINMPNMDGYAVCQELKACEFHEKMQTDNSSCKRHKK